MALILEFDPNRPRAAASRAPIAWCPETIELADRIERVSRAGGQTSAIGLIIESAESRAGLARWDAKPPDDSEYVDDSESLTLADFDDDERGLRARLVSEPLVDLIDDLEIIAEIRPRLLRDIQRKTQHVIGRHADKTGECLPVAKGKRTVAKGKKRRTA